MRTREEDRLYMRQYRARKRAEAAVASSTVTEPTTTDVQDAVRAELDPLPATTTRPGLVTAAIKMAAILDDPKSAPHHAAAARSLGDIPARLHSQPRGGSTKLAAMRAIRRDE